jgi:hypothetical protein
MDKTSNKGIAIPRILLIKTSLIILLLNMIGNDSLFRTSFYTFLAAFTPFRVVYTGMFVKYNINFANHTIGAYLDTLPACLALACIEGNVLRTVTIPSGGWMAMLQLPSL